MLNFFFQFVIFQVIYLEGNSQVYILGTWICIYKLNCLYFFGISHYLCSIFLLLDILLLI